MSARTKLPWVLAIASVASCANPTLDHYWDYDKCELISPSGEVPSSHAAAYLRRSGGASGLMIQLNDHAGGIGSPYPASPTVRFSVARETVAPATLTVVPNADDVRGPVVIAPGQAWLMSNSGQDRDAAGDGWRLGSGSLVVSQLTITENDTSDRDFVTLDATFDLSGVKVAAIGDTTTTPQPVGGVFRIRCADQPLAALSQGTGGASGSGGDTGAGGNPVVGAGGDPTGGSGMGGDGGGGSGGMATDLPTGTLLASEVANGVSVGDAGVAWLVPFSQPGVQNSGVARFLGADGTQSIPGTMLHFGGADRVIVDGANLYFASYPGLWQSTPPAPAMIFAQGTQPDSTRLLGTTATHVYVAYLAQGSPAFTVIRRFDRTTLNPELFACATPTFVDATLDPATGSVFMTDLANVRRHDVPVGGQTCSTASPAQVVAGLDPGETMARVAVAGTHLIYVATGPAGITVRSGLLDGSVAPVVLGKASTFVNLTVPVIPLAVGGETAFWVDAAPLSMAPMSYQIVTAPADGSSAAVGIAKTGASVVDLAASSGSVVWADESGVHQLAR